MASEPDKNDFIIEGMEVMVEGTSKCAKAKARENRSDQPLEYRVNLQALTVTMRLSAS